MKNKFTENEAIGLVMANSIADQKNKNLIIVESGSVKGLKTCSAVDFLNNHTKVRVVFKAKGRE